MLALLYFLFMLFIIVKLRQLMKLSSTHVLDTRKMLAGSMFLACFLRTCSFITIAVVNRRGYDAGFHGSGQATAIVVQGASGTHRMMGSRLDFFEKSMLVLFDLPDYIIVSSFTLLVLVWAEVFLDSRAHWLSNKDFRRRALLGYMIFNASVYATQLVLYSLLFVPSISIKLLRLLLFCSVATLNFVVPLGFTSLAFYLYFKLSGFPYKGESGRAAVDKTTRVVRWWTAGRIVWAAAALSSAIRDWLTNFSGSSELYAVSLVFIFTLTELVPFSVALDADFLPILAFAHGHFTAAVDKEKEHLLPRDGGRGGDGARTRQQGGSSSGDVLELDRFASSSFDFDVHSNPSYGALDMQDVERQLATPESKGGKHMSPAELKSSGATTAAEQPLGRHRRQHSEASQKSGNSLSFGSVDAAPFSREGT